MFGKGTPPVQSTLPTMVSRTVTFRASRMVALFSGAVVRVGPSLASSKGACPKPIGCVHCLLVAAVYPSARSFAVWPVSDELKGWLGLHQTSLESASPSPLVPNASTEAGKRSALPMEAIFGVKPCCLAWFQKVVKSGGMGTPVTISAEAVLKAPIWAEKTGMMSSRPQKKWYVHSNGTGFAGSFWRPKKYGCHGATVEMQGTWLASAWSDTGFVVSGVEATSMRSIPSWRMRSPATSAARCGSDWLSLARIWMGCSVPPTFTPPAKAALAPARMD